MAVTSSIQSKSIKKFVLQQSNCNLDTSHDKDEDQKLLDKTVYEIKVKKETELETENQRSPQKVFKSEAKKLRSIRLDLSSLKRGVIQKANPQKKESSEESSEDEVKNKRKPRPVVPNYVTNTDSGPCRKPRQSRQDPLVLSSQFPTRTSSQSLSIARRNARERNRVKQVNEGFASLRSRIPDYISDAYNEEKGRKGAKKLSKVETLRMALDYIRHLETLLDLKSEKEVWMKPIKVEEQPWETPHSGEFPSPKYQPPCVESPSTNYDQAFEYQERIFYEVNLNFVPQKESEEKTATLTVLGNENQCVDDFKYYETFNRIKKEGSEDITEKAVGEEEEEPDEEVIVKVEEEDQEVEEIEVEEEKEEQRDPEVLLLPKDVIQKVPKSVLPSITESFNKTIPVFF